MYKSILEKVKKVISDVVEDKDIDIQNLTENSEFVLELGMNSIDTLQLLSLIEIEFNIFIEDDELNSELVSNLGNLCSFVLKKIDSNRL